MNKFFYRAIRFDVSVKTFTSLKVLVSVSKLKDGQYHFLFSSGGKVHSTSIIYFDGLVNETEFQEFRRQLFFRLLTFLIANSVSTFSRFQNFQFSSENLLFDYLKFPLFHNMGK